MEALCWQRILPQVPRSEADLLGEGPASLSLLSIADEGPWGLQGRAERSSQEEKRQN